MNTESFSKQCIQFSPRARPSGTAGSGALIPLGFALAGWTTTHWGPAPTFLLGGVITAVLTTGLLLGVRSLRQLD